MRNISFSLTTPQILDKTKTVTRRLRWLFVKAGDQLQACEKCMGLKPGQKINRLCVIEVVSARREPLNVITPSDVRKEGFPHLTPAQFVEMFCRNMKCEPDEEITRIEFRYL